MAQDLVPPPPIRSTVDEFAPDGRPMRVMRTWAAFFGQVFSVCFAVSQSGTTAQRPDEGLWTGRPYFDTTLGQPIWWDGTEWVDADGASA